MKTITLKKGDLNGLILEGNIKSKKVMNKQADRHKKAKSILGHQGRMIAGSKSYYHYKNPRNVTVFNSNICTEEGKIWHGDIDMTLDEDKLKELSLKVKTPIYVLYEMDARFENEEKPLLNKALFKISDGEVEILERDSFDGTLKTLYVRQTRGKLKGRIVLKKEYTWDMSHLYGRKARKEMRDYLKSKKK